MNSNEPQPIVDTGVVDAMDVDSSSSTEPAALPHPRSGVGTDAAASSSSQESGAALANDGPMVEQPHLGSFMSSLGQDENARTLLTSRAIRMLSQTYSLPVTHQRLLQAMRAASESEAAFEAHGAGVRNPNTVVDNSSGHEVSAAGGPGETSDIVAGAVSGAETSFTAMSSGNENNNDGGGMSVTNGVGDSTGGNPGPNPALASTYMEQWLELLSHYEHFLTASGVTQSFAEEESKVNYPPWQALSFPHVLFL